MAKKKSDLKKILKNLDDWNKKTDEYLRKMYKKKGNPGDETLRLLEGVSKQNEALKEITIRVENLPKIRDNTTYILATLAFLTAYLIGLGFLLITKI